VEQTAESSNANQCRHDRWNNHEGEDRVEHDAVTWFNTCGPNGREHDRVHEKESDNRIPGPGSASRPQDHGVV
jgi:hypothetical protein